MCQARQLLQSGTKMELQNRLVEFQPLTVSSLKNKRKHELVEMCKQRSLLHTGSMQALRDRLSGRICEDLNQSHSRAQPITKRQISNIARGARLNAENSSPKEIEEKSINEYILSLKRRPTTTELMCYDRQPNVAIMMFLNNAGLLFRSRAETSQERKSDLMEHLKSYNMNDDIEEQCLRDYQAAMNINGFPESCAACPHPLDPLLMDSSRLAEINSIPDICRPAVNTVTSGTRTWHMIPDLVFEDLTGRFVTLCDKCSNELHQERAYKYSLKNGYDFGNLKALLASGGLRIEDISLLERLCCQDTILIMRTIKMVPKRLLHADNAATWHLTGHVIATVIDSKNTVPLPNATVPDYLQIQIIGAINGFSAFKESLRSGQYGDLKADARIVVTQISLDAMVSNILDKAVYVDQATATREQLYAAETAVRLDNFVSDHVTNIHSRDDDRGDIHQPTTATLPTVLLTDTRSLPTQSPELQILEAVSNRIATEEADFDDMEVDGDAETDSAAMNVVDDGEDISDDEMEEVETAVPTSATPTARIGQRVQISAGTTLVNEFDEIAELLRGAFPLNFLLGEGVENPLSNELQQHYFQQYNNSFIDNLDFIMLRFNQQQRHTAIQTVAIRAKTQHGSFGAFNRILNRPNLKNQLEAAKKNPHTTPAKKLIKELSEVVNVIGTEIPYSKASRRGILSKILNLSRYNSPPVFYGTIASMDSPLIMKLCFQGRNQDWIMPADLKTRILETQRHPGLTAKVFQKMVENVFEHLLRIKFSHTTRRSAPLESHPMGGAGRISNAVAVGETGGGGNNMHVHVLLFSPFNGNVFDDAVWDPDIQKICADFLDSILVAELSSSSWLQINNNTLPRMGMFESPYKSIDSAGHEERQQNQLMLTNLHEHSETCRKGKAGKHHCRMSKESGINSDGTRPVWFQLFESGTVQEISVENEERYKHLVSPDNIQNAWLEPPEDDFRSEKYRLMNTLKLLAQSMGSNTDFQLLGNHNSATNAAFYISGYMAKSSSQVNLAIPALTEAIISIERFPSNAADAGTERRNTTHHLQRFLNNITSLEESSAPMMAACLLGMPDNWYTCNFVYVNIHVVIDEIEATIKANTLSENSSEVASTDSDVADSQLFESCNSREEDMVLEEQNAATGPSTSAGVYTIDGKKLAVDYLHQYQYRGPELYEMSFAMYRCCIKVEPKRQHKQSTHKLAARFPFASGCMLEFTHDQQIKSKLSVPEYAGSPPPICRNVILEDVVTAVGAYQGALETLESLEVLLEGDWKKSTDKFHSLLRHCINLKYLACSPYFGESTFGISELINVLREHCKRLQVLKIINLNVKKIEREGLAGFKKGLRLLASGLRAMATAARYSRAWLLLEDDIPWDIKNEWVTIAVANGLQVLAVRDPFATVGYDERVGGFTELAV
ncbi:hypothetical protein HDU76_004280 [Blyttiomyces sp. JEL0837]|nr:hypothetical protein HDU76_004280 [Blyttiomyces sp. JEL0837]